MLIHRPSRNISHTLTYSSLIIRNIQQCTTSPCNLHRRPTYPSTPPLPSIRLTIQITSPPHTFPSTYHCPRIIPHHLPKARIQLVLRQQNTCILLPPRISMASGLRQPYPIVPWTRAGRRLARMRDLTRTVLWRIRKRSRRNPPAVQGAFFSCNLWKLADSIFFLRACTVCRRLKMKCVGAEQGPPCKRCLSGNHECIFEESNRGKRSSKCVFRICLFRLPILILHFLQKTWNPHPLFAQNGANSRHSSPIHRESQHCLGHDFPLTFTFRTNSRHPSSSRSIALTAPRSDLP